MLVVQIKDGLGPIAFHSRNLNAVEANYSATERALLAIVDNLS